MITSIDVGMSTIEGLTGKAIIGRIMGKNVKGESLKGCMEERWKPVMGYVTPHMA